MKLKELRKGDKFIPSTGGDTEHLLMITNTKGLQSEEIEAHSVKTGRKFVLSPEERVILIRT